MLMGSFNRNWAQSIGIQRSFARGIVLCCKNVLNLRLVVLKVSRIYLLKK